MEGLLNAKRGRGRPPKSDGPRTKQYRVRLSEEEYNELVFLRNEVGITLADMVRETIKERYSRLKNL